MKEKLKIGIIGAGKIGATLTRHFTRLGHDVVVANSRGPETLADFAKETGAKAVPVAEAARGRDLVVVTIPERKVPELPPGLFRNAPAGLIVIDTGNYYPRQRDGKIEGIENVIFPSFVMGTPITNLTQANNTYSLIDNLSKVRGSHTLKVGMQVSLEQVNVNPNPTFNGSFLISGTENGNEFADFLIGVASNYNQADSQAYYGRHKYAA